MLWGTKLLHYTEQLVITVPNTSFLKNNQDDKIIGSYEYPLAWYMHKCSVTAIPTAFPKKIAIPRSTIGIYNFKKFVTSKWDSTPEEIETAMIYVVWNILKQCIPSLPDCSVSF